MLFRDEQAMPLEQRTVVKEYQRGITFINLIAFDFAGNNFAEYALPFGRAGQIFFFQIF
jgi:hypothetical protein